MRTKNQVLIEELHPYCTMLECKMSPMEVAREMRKRMAQLRADDLILINHATFEREEMAEPMETREMLIERGGS